MQNNHANEKSVKVCLQLLMMHWGPAVFVLGLFLTGIDGITQAAEVTHHRPHKLCAC